MKADRVVDVDLVAAPESIRPLRRLLDDIAGAPPPLGGSRLFDLKVAVSEACANAVEAQRRVGATTPIHVTVRRFDPATIEVTVVDRGGGFDVAAVESDLRHGRERGRGLGLMQRLVDRVELSADETGTTARLRIELEAATGSGDAGTTGNDRAHR